MGVVARPLHLSQFDCYLLGLSSFVREPGVRQRIRRIYSRPATRTLRLEPSLPRGKDSKLIGTAFDYLLRFYLERLYPHAVTGRWFAERVVENFELDVRHGHSIHVQSGEAPSSNDSRRTVAVVRLIEDAKPVVVEIQKLLNTARSNHRTYLSNGIVSTDLLRSCCILAKLDWIERGGQSGKFVPARLNEIEHSTIEELRELLARVNPMVFHSESRCILNPSFPSAEPIGGADGDLILDDRLVELKVTYSRTHDWRDWDQLVGYYIMHLLGGVAEFRHRFKIRRLGIYSARFATYSEIPIDTVVEKKALDSLSWFRAQLAKR